MNLENRFTMTISQHLIFSKGDYLGTVKVDDLKAVICLQIPQSPNLDSWEDYQMEYEQIVWKIHKMLQVNLN